MGVLLQGFAVPQLQRLGVKLPDDDGHVLGAGCELEAVGRELAVPDLFAVVVEHLKYVLVCCDLRRLITRIKF